MAVASRRRPSEDSPSKRDSIKSVKSIGTTATYTSDDCIRKQDIFCKCDAKFMDEVIACFDVAVFSPGTVLLEEGTENSNFWVVHRGSVEVLDKEHCIRHLEDGDSYGEAEFLGVRRKTRETLRASTFVDMRVLSREKLIQVLAHHPYERAVLSHIAISRKLEARRCQLPRSDRVEDANAWKERLRDLEDQQAKLAQVLRVGRKSARVALEFDKIPVRAIFGEREERRSSNRGTNGHSSWKPPRGQTTRLVVVEETLPGCWHTLNDWHRQLAASTEGHRLNLWQLDKYRGSTTTPSSASRTSRMASTTCSTARPHSRCAEQSLASTLPPRPHSVASTTPSSTMVLQPPYPQVPQSPMRDPACLNRGCRRSVPKKMMGQSCTSSSCKRPLSMQSNHQDGDATSFDEATSSWQEMLASTPAVPIPSAELPPGLAEAVGELSRGYLRSKWHCENLARTEADRGAERRREVAARSRGNGLATPSSRLLPDPARSRPSVSIQSNSIEESVEEAHNHASIVTPTKAARAPSTGVPPVQREKMSRLEGNFRPPSSSPVPMVRKQFAPAQRRLEMTLRGNFKSDLFEIGGGDPDDALIEATNVDDPDEAARRALSSTSCFSDPEVAAISQRLRTEMDMDALRARMGFGREEGGATPSGRSSVPACRRDMYGGALSAPPLNNPAVDEGIELSSLEQSLEYHVFRILERSLRGPSRATSCEPQESFRGSPSPSPTPTHQVASSPRSSCPSPSPRGLVEELNLGVHLRLCQSRCGSSSAVLELVFDHCKDCSEVCGCVCYPTPDEAEARLLAYFARHTYLRLAATQLPVRVLLEPLDGDEDHDDGRVSV